MSVAHPISIERRLLAAAALLALSLSLLACSNAASPDPVLGHAFIGAASIQIRAELAARAPLVATLKHGDRVDIIGRRRRFYKIRASSGAEGWIDGRQLLSTSGMDELRRLAERAASAPSQGRATVFEPLNVHSEANRTSPSFFQLTPQMSVDVIAHERAPRLAYQPPEFIDPTPVLARKPRKKKAPDIAPPPAPKPPQLPGNWLELSQRPAAIAAPPQPSEPAPAPVPPPPADEWTLVRTAQGRAGWVLSRMLLMSIPDEVAQYAERARIAAYFKIGEVRDNDTPHPTWLWAALAQRGADFDFDSLRIFSWNPRRHRYETSFIERNLRAHLPITLDPAHANPAASFTVFVEDPSGNSLLRRYSISGSRARLASQSPAPLPDSFLPESSPARRKSSPQKPGPAPSWSNRASDLINTVKDKLKR